jgi:hypothetical protein
MGGGHHLLVKLARVVDGSSASCEEFGVTPEAAHAVWVCRRDGDCGGNSVGDFTAGSGQKNHLATMEYRTAFSKGETGASPILPVRLSSTSLIRIKRN